MKGKAIVYHMYHKANYSPSDTEYVEKLMAATAFNMRKWMRLKKEEILNLIFRWLFQRQILPPVNIQL